MIGLDTNIFIRLFAQDDSKQLKDARQLISEKCSQDDPGHVSIIVLAELVWTLAKVYDFSRDDISFVLRSLIESKDLSIEHENHVLSSLMIFDQSTSDFPDILIGEINNAAGCETTMTFDKKASKLSSFTKI